MPSSRSRSVRGRRKRAPSPEIDFDVITPKRRRRKKKENKSEENKTKTDKKRKRTSKSVGKRTKTLRTSPSARGSGRKRKTAPMRQTSPAHDSDEDQWGGSTGLSPGSSTKTSTPTRRKRDTTKSTSQWGGTTGLSPSAYRTPTRRSTRSKSSSSSSSSSRTSSKSKKSDCCNVIKSLLKQMFVFFVVVMLIGYLSSRDIQRSMAQFRAIGSPSGQGQLLVESPRFETDGSPRCNSGFSYDALSQMCVENVCPPIHVEAHETTAGASCPGGRVTTHPTCTFACTTDYVISGHAYIACDENGRWETSPRCHLSNGVVTSPAPLHGTSFPHDADEDENGMLDRAEMRRALGDRSSDGLLTLLFNTHDKNRDGHLDANEVSAAKQHLVTGSFVTKRAIGWGGAAVLCSVVAILMSSASSSTTKATVKSAKNVRARPSTTIVSKRASSSSSCTVVEAPIYVTSGATSRAVVATPVYASAAVQAVKPSAPPMPCDDPNAGYYEDPNAGYR